MSAPQNSDITGTESHIEGNNHGSPDTKIPQTLRSEHHTNVVPSERHIRRNMKVRANARPIKGCL